MYRVNLTISLFRMFFVFVFCLLKKNVMLCYVMLCYVMLCYVMLCYVMLCYVMLCYVMLCYVMLCYVIGPNRNHHGSRAFVPPYFQGLVPA